MTEARPSYDPDRRRVALRRIEFSVCYHRKRERFFDQLDRWTKGIAIIGGSAAFVGLVGEAPDTAGGLPGGGFTAQISAVAVAVTSTLALVFGLAERARHHADLAKQFLELEADMIRKSDDDSDIAEWEARTRLLEASEPPALNALVIICQNEIAVAAREPVYVLPWWQRAFAHWWSFSIDPNKLKRIESAPLTTAVQSREDNKANRATALPYAALLVASAAVALTTIYLRGDSTGLDPSLARAIGEIVGLALVPMLLLPFVGPRVSVAALVVIALAYMQSHLQLLG